jgi:hypothetical protein
VKKTLIAIAVVLAIAGLAVFIYREQIGMMLAFGRLKPERAFDAALAPAAPDYSDAMAWAALPDREDPADVVPDASVEDQQATAEVDVFFVHPTTYYKAAGWNQPLGDASANQLTDMFVLRGQASVFNGCCRIYAPRYRQATLYSFMDSTGSGQAALKFAYQDVERAFDYFITHYNQGRPFVLAGHSQGSLHLRTLLETRITGTPLRERMIAAYPIGFAIDREALAASAPDIPVCTSAEQFNCLVTWNAVGPHARSWGDTSKSVCVNPLTWKVDDGVAGHALNLGGVTYPGTFEGSIADLVSLPQDFIDGKPVLQKAVADAQCVNGMLRVQEIRSQNYAARPMGRDNYHVFDYSLFHMNLRQNVAARVRAFLSRVSPRDDTA